MDIKNLNKTIIEIEKDEILILKELLTKEFSYLKISKNKFDNAMWNIYWNKLAKIQNKLDEVNK